MFRNLWWILHFAAEFDACVNKFSCRYCDILKGNDDKLIPG
jgi:hypothetical protein